MTLTTMSSHEAKQQWGSVMKAASAPDDAVIVESNGKPKVAISRTTGSSGCRSWRSRHGGPGHWSSFA